MRCIVVPDSSCDIYGVIADVPISRAFTLLIYSAVSTSLCTMLNA